VIMTTEPRQIVERIEEWVSLPQVNGGGDHNLAGYGVIGLPFRSGHVLALRRFPVSPEGPGYTSVWHRSPLGIWTLFSTTRPKQRRPHFDGNEILHDVVTPIQMDWSGPRQFSIRIGERDLRWNVTLSESAASRLVNAVSGWIPDSWWKNSRIARAIGSLSQYVLGTGPMNVRANPGRVWLVASSTARVKGKDIGEPGALEKQARFHEFLIPQRGLFAVTQSYLP